MDSFTPNQNPNTPRRYSLIRRTTKDHDSMLAFNSMGREEAKELLRQMGVKPARTVTRIDFTTNDSTEPSSYIYLTPKAQPEEAYRHALDSFDRLRSIWPEPIKLARIEISNTDEESPK